MCVYCGGSLQESTMDYVEKIDNYVIVIKNVPCKKCMRRRIFFYPGRKKKNLMIWQLKYLIYCNDRNMALLSIQAFAKEKEEHCEP